MSHRPYPSTDRALHQLGRHQAATPPALGGITGAEAGANLARNIQLVFGRAKWAPAPATEAR